MFDSYLNLKIKSVFFSVATREPWELSLIVDIDVDVVIDVISRGKLGSKFAINNSDNVMSIDILSSSPVSSGIEVSLVSSALLLLEKVDVSLLDWVDS